MNIEETLPLWPDSEDVPAADPMTFELDSLSTEIGVTTDGADAAETRRKP